MKVKSDHRSKFSNLSHWKEEAWCDALPTELWSHTLGKLTSLLMLVEHRTGIRGGHGFESRWSPDFFRLLLSNCLNWKIYCDDRSNLTSIYNRSSDMNYFISTSQTECFTWKSWYLNRLTILFCQSLPELWIFWNIFYETPERAKREISKVKSYFLKCGT